jgi:hypothetical protein
MVERPKTRGCFQDAPRRCVIYQQSNCRSDHGIKKYTPFLILAAADAAERLCLPPLELEYAFQSKEYSGALPNAGGLRNQPVTLLTRMRVCLNVYNAMTEYMAAEQSTDWTQKNHTQWEIVVMVMNLRAKRDKGEL